MKVWGIVVGGLAWAALLAPASAQSPAPGSDPIGDILGRMTPEMEEPDLASQPARIEPHPEAALPAAPIPYSQVAPYRPAPYGPSTSGAPTRLDETGKSPDGPPTVRDLAYTSRLRASFASAQGFQGPMDGGWVVVDPSGRELYRLQLADRGRGVVEGAWRDPRRPGQPDASGFIDQIERSGASTVLRFEGVTATFQGSGTSLSGEIDESGRRVSATLRRISQP
ncbi:hypothetical protein [Phenylobacterium immobile]|uniref:hypothetical protein n=1 Tax=Phenylobacterium immobile TaxID=21 RepID=UPI000A5A337C|nr:hypothetical protein [Phenylobacterium immobile]